MRQALAISYHFFFIFFKDPAPSDIYTLSLHDALPISAARAAGTPWYDRLWHSVQQADGSGTGRSAADRSRRSEEHTSELQSHSDLVCRLLLEKKNIDKEKKITKSYRQIKKRQLEKSRW